MGVKQRFKDVGGRGDRESCHRTHAAYVPVVLCGPSDLSSQQAEASSFQIRKAKFKAFG